ncbi:MAG: ABC transporter permease [Myxococcota bacterium]|nr:ABC transporter permease [Myxococcales bacterium]
MSLSPRHALAVWRRSLAMYAQSWKWNLLPNFFEPVFYLASLGIGVGAYITEMGGRSYAEFLAPGLVCVAAMNGASFEVTYNTFVRLEFEKTYDLMLTAPIEADDVLAGELLWAMTRVMLYGGIFYFVTIAFGLAPLPHSLAMLGVIPLTGLLFGALGFAFTLRIPTIDLFSFYFTLFLTPLFLFSGVFFPIEERLSGAWLWVAEATPLLHPVRLAHMAFEGSFRPIALWDVAYVLAATAGLLAWTRVRLRERLES